MKCTHVLAPIELQAIKFDNMYITDLSQGCISAEGKGKCNRLRSTF